MKVAVFTSVSPFLKRPGKETNYKIKMRMNSFLRSFATRSSPSILPRERARTSKKVQNTPNALRLNLAERVLRDRKVTKITEIMHSAEERVTKQMSTRTAHKILPLSKGDNAADQVRLLARKMLLDQRRRASLPFTDKNGVPQLQPVNGVGRFVLPLTRVHFMYCSHRADSTGLREFLSKNLKELVTSNPGIEYVVEPRWGEFPQIKGFFVNGNEKQLCVKNFSTKEIYEAFMKLRNSSGKKLQKFKQKVTSTAPAIRPLWSPFHMLSDGKNNPFQRFVPRLRPMH